MVGPQTCHWDQGMNTVIAAFCEEVQAEVNDDIETHQGAVFSHLKILLVSPNFISFFWKSWNPKTF